jgi:NAD+ synthase (glutamine-hydrolysing)
VKIAIAQINCTVGDLDGNASKILDIYQQSKEAGAELMITPELALCGYPPQDWLLRKDFIQACQQTLASLAAKIHDVILIVGHPHFINGKLFNAASIIQAGRISATYCKNHLLIGGPLNERHYFEPGDQPCTFEHNGITFGLAICSDCQYLPHLQATHQAGAQVMLWLNASPYRIDKQADRHRVIREGIAQTGMSAIYVNLVGGQDELVFDGASFVMNSNGEITYQLAAFQEVLGLTGIEAGQPTLDKCCPLPDRITGIYSALCLGMRDFIVKNGFPGVLIGLSGGIDSALVLAIAVDALGVEQVKTVMMPSPYTADISIQDAREMARNLGVQHTEIPINSIFDNFLQTLSTEFQTTPAIGNPSTTENLQARIRGVLLMALANQFGLLVLTTSNKSETAVGYSTLYGDMAGGFSVLKDVSKTLVYQLCYYRNQIEPIIPERILQRPPSAELRPDQTDQDSLPPYDRLDTIIAAHVENGMSLKEITSMNYPEEEVRHVLHLIHSNEYKRRQAAPGIRITRRDFGKSWSFPLTSKFLK